MLPGNVLPVSRLVDFIALTPMRYRDPIRSKTQQLNKHAHVN
jgi:hypothetical protein